VVLKFYRLRVSQSKYFVFDCSLDFCLLPVYECLLKCLVRFEPCLLPSTKIAGCLWGCLSPALSCLGLSWVVLSPRLGLVWSVCLAYLARFSSARFGLVTMIARSSSCFRTNSDGPVAACSLSSECGVNRRRNGNDRVCRSASADCQCPIMMSKRFQSAGVAFL